MLIFRQKSFQFCTPHLKTSQPVLPYCKASEKLACSEILLANDKKMLEYQIKEMTEIQNIQETKIQSNSDLLKLMVEKRIAAQRELSESKKREKENTIKAGTTMEKALESALQKNRDLTESNKKVFFLSQQLEDREREIEQIQHKLFVKNDASSIQNECTEVGNSGLR